MNRLSEKRQNSLHYCACIPFSWSWMCCRKDEPSAERSNLEAKSLHCCSRISATQGDDWKSREELVKCAHALSTGVKHIDLRQEPRSPSIGSSAALIKSRGFAHEFRSWQVGRSACESPPAVQTAGDHGPGLVLLSFLWFLSSFKRHRAIFVG